VLGPLDREREHVGRASRRKAERRHGAGRESAGWARPTPWLDELQVEDALASILGIIAAAQQSTAVASERLRLVREVRPLLDQAELAAWLDARDDGLSWRELGEVLGMGKSGAQMRAGQLQAAEERRARTAGDTTR
jgi:hypothetical protein